MIRITCISLGFSEAESKRLHSRHAIVGEQDLANHALSLPLLDIAGQRIQIHRLMSGADGPSGRLRRCLNKGIWCNITMGLG